uniref:Uncharacterized protein n=1 Tax=Arundo donax TaxID=35708 RepID=A0A0A9HFN9_ARUDO
MLSKQLKLPVLPSFELLRTASREFLNHHSFYEFLNHHSFYFLQGFCGTMELPSHSVWVH